MQDIEFNVPNGIYGRSWAPDKNPKAVIAVLHGFGDHINRYEDFARFFTSNRVAVMGLDYRGHGRSAGKRGHLGNYAMILRSVQQLMLEARRTYTETPIFLFGQSLGGNLAMSYALRHTSKEIQGVIISAPYIIPSGSIAGGGFLNIPFIGRFFPSYTMTFNLDPMELSHDPVVGIKYLEDPVKHDKISIRFYRQLVRSSIWILEHAGRMAYPLLIMHGQDDGIISWKHSEDLADRMQEMAELKVWEGMRHELHHERSKIMVLEYLLDWITGKLGKR